jgi:hypothetical protein
MLTTEETLVVMRREMRPLLQTAMEGMLTTARGVLEEAEHQRAEGLANVAEERAKGRVEIAKERANGLAEVDVRWAVLHREVTTMQTHKEAQEGRVELNIGGCRFETSVQTLRSVPQTFFDAYFSGRYEQDVCDDGSIFVDRDGEHFGHVLEYMCDGVVSVAEPGACPSVSLLRALKREFGFYCIALCAEEPVELEMAYVMGGYTFDDGVDEGFYQMDRSVTHRSMERYDATSGQWSAVAAMGTVRSVFGVCVVSGEIYVTGGQDSESNALSSVEKYTPSSDTWSTVAPLPAGRTHHAAVAVGSTMYVLGGDDGDNEAAFLASVLKYDSTQGA